MYLKDIEEVIKVQWGRTYLWDIKFIGGDVPSPFNEWFPAIDIDNSDGSINSFEFDGGSTSMKVPQSKSSSEIKITFVDRDFDVDKEKYNLYEWMLGWRRQVIKTDGTVWTLSEIVKHILIAKLNTKKEIVKTFDHWVYPEGDISFVGNSDNNVPTYSATLIKVG